MTYIWRPIHWQ